MSNKRPQLRQTPDGKTTSPNTKQDKKKHASQGTGGRGTVQRTLLIEGGPAAAAPVGPAAVAPVGDSQGDADNFSDATSVTSVEYGSASAAASGRRLPGM